MHVMECDESIEENVILSLNDSSLCDYFMKAYNI